MWRKFNMLLTGALLGGAAMVMVQSIASSVDGADAQTYRRLAVFGDIYERVRAQYVTEPDEKKLVENAINGMLSSLDPHSSYMDVEAAKDMRANTKGEFGGLGIEVTMENDVVKVIAPIDETPAWEAGVMAGDLIVKIDGEDLRGQTLTEAVDKMRGEVGKPITLTILRESAAQPIEITITRAIIKVRAVRHRVEGDVGYIRIIQFTEQTTTDLERAIAAIQREVKDEDLKGYVLDMRLNPGGLLDQAVNVSDAFLERGEIVSIRGRNPQEVTRFDSEPGDLTGGKPVIVLVNGGSASASEIVAGALQDQRRATVLGTRSFGKGSVQTIIPLGENGALRLTTALYYTPSGKSIQGKGIVPDIVVEQPLPEELKDLDLSYGESSLKGHIQGKEEDEQGSGSAAYVPREVEEDVQIQMALKLLRGEEVNAAFPPDPDAPVLEQEAAAN